MVQRPGERHGAPERLAHDDGIAHAEFRRRLRKERRLFLGPLRLAREGRGVAGLRLVGVAVPGAVEDDDAVAVRHPVDEVEGIVAHVPARAVDQDEVGTLARDDRVNLPPVDLDDATHRREARLGRGLHPVGANVDPRTAAAKGGHGHGHGGDGLECAHVPVPYLSRLKLAANARSATQLRRSVEACPISDMSKGVVRYISLTQLP